MFEDFNFWMLLLLFLVVSLACVSRCASAPGSRGNWASGVTADRDLDAPGGWPGYPDPDALSDWPSEPDGAAFWLVDPALALSAAQGAEAVAQGEHARTSSVTGQRAATRFAAASSSATNGLTSAFAKT